MSISSIPAEAHMETAIPGATNKPSSGPRETGNACRPGSERRAQEEPTRQLNRRLFDRIAGLIHRYSHDPLAKNEHGEYITSDEKVRALLTHEIEELKKLDPLIPLMIELATKYQYQEVESGRLQVVSYKIVNPSIKALNDVYLGPNQTDDYTEDLHAAIDAELSAHNAKLLNNHYKGGVFFVDHGPSNGHTPQEHAAMMQAHEERIKEVAKQILIKHLEKRHDDLLERVADYSLEAIKNNQRQLRDLINQLQYNEEKVEIAFGFEDISAHGNITNALTSILNAEREANMVSLEHKKNKKNGRPSEKKEARKYSHEKLLVELISATLTLYNQILDENGKIKPEWDDFFKQNQDDIVNMRRSMIQKYRKIEQYRESSEYRRMPPEKRDDFERKLQVFDAYYQQINVVDVLKKTTFESMGVYIERIRSIVSFITGAERQLASETPDSELLRLCLSRSSAELEVSLKDEGYKTVHTTRASIKALMSGEEAVLVFGDNIGFAGLNQSGYENSALSLIDSLGLTGDEIQSVISTRSHDKSDNDKPTISIHRRELASLVRRKLRQVKDTASFQQILLSIGDEGTSYLRANQKLLTETFNGQAVASADGGDEDIVVYTKANGCKIPEDPIQIERALFAVSDEAKIRIAAVYGDMRFDTMPEYDQETGVTQQTRSQIVKLLRAHLFAEFAHRKIKAEGRTVIETMPADKIMT